MNTENFFAELKRRNVYKVAVAYAVVGWLVVQISSTVLPTFHAPEWVVQTLVVLVALGFPIALVLAWAFELTPEGIKRADEVAPDESITRKSGRKLVGITVALAVIAAGLFAFQWLRPTSTLPPPQSETANTSTTPVPLIPEKSIAVLPFENLSSDKENAYFAEGIQDEILTRLAKIGALKVISRKSTSHYASSPQNLPEIARQLGVANLLEGSVQKSKDAVHINVQLIRAATDDHLWAESYDRKLDDIFGVEGEVAQNIASALNAKLSGAEQQVLAQKPTSNSAAYEAYLRGNTQFWQATEDSLQGATQSYEEAVRLDPQFALAWARLGQAYSIAFTINDTTPRQQAAAEKCIVEAERLQPELPETQLARAYLDYFVLHHYKAARDRLEQLQVTWPGNGEVAQFLAQVCEGLGEWQKSREYYAQAVTLSPQDIITRRWAIGVEIDLRDFTTAMRMLNDALQVWPGNINLLGLKAQTFQAIGKLDEAQSILNTLAIGDKDYDAKTPLLYQAKLRRDPLKAIAFFEALVSRENPGADWLLDAVGLAELQDLLSEKSASQATFIKVRDTAQALLHVQPENLTLIECLGRALAGLNERAAALNVIDKGIALPDHPHYLEELRARTLARFGDKDGAITIVQHLLQIPYYSSSGVPLTPALLRIDPDWDNLRGDPRFEKLCQEQQP